MKNQFRLGLVLLGALPLAPALLATQIANANPADVAIHTPRPGSKERSAIMNALRIPLTKFHKGKRVTFNKVDEFRVGGGWAHLSAQTIDASNKPLGPAPEARYMPLSALLHLEKGKWRVVVWAYHGDVVQTEWSVQYPKAPLNILGLSKDVAG